MMTRRVDEDGFAKTTAVGTNAITFTKDDARLGGLTPLLARPRLR